MRVGLRARTRSTVLSVFERAGMRIERLEDTSNMVEGGGATRSPELMWAAHTVPGMVSMRRGMYYYWLAYAGVPGDVVEIGCWQGRSTTFLGQACKDAGNGVVHAVDTFTGNPGNEDAYQVGAADLSDLETNFRANMERVGLRDHVRIYPGRSEELAARVLAETDGVRMLVVDGEHTYEAVSQELALYADALEVGGLIVFDDYSKAFDGVVRAVNEHIETTGRYATPVQDHNLLVARRVR